MKPNDRWMNWVVETSAAGVGPLPFQRGARPGRRAPSGTPPSLPAAPAGVRPVPGLRRMPVRLALPV